jgi:hypothetical protein
MRCGDCVANIRCVEKMKMRRLVKNTAYIGRINVHKNSIQKYVEYTSFASMDE